MLILKYHVNLLQVTNGYMKILDYGYLGRIISIYMTPKELYELAVENGMENHNMVFTVDVGNETVELDIANLERGKSHFDFVVELF